MKKLFFFTLLTFIMQASYGQGNNLDKGQIGYVPSKKNLKNREWFRDAHFGMFIHWGVSSVLGQEIGWALSGKDVNEYRQNMKRFNPVKFDAAGIVKIAKDAGMKYITFTTRHHDSFSMFDTKYSDWSIMNTPYGKDVLKMLSDECRRQGIRLYCYYSLADFYRPDYCQGNTRKATGIQGECDWESYIQFMKDQLTEILSNYGPVYGIWLDGHWDQVERVHKKNGNQMREWRYNEIYKLIHDLQPGCMIVNNHHLSVFPGEDFQTFERDLPGQNTGGGYSRDAVISEDLPIETCDIIGRSWGYVTNDTVNRSVRELIHLLIGSAGRGGNLLLNVGPTPEGEIRPEHKERLLEIGKWMTTYGETVYGTRRSFIQPSDWGVAVEKKNKVYLHITDPSKINRELVIEHFPYEIKEALMFETGKPLEFRMDPEASSLILQLPETGMELIDNVIVLKVSK